eukprot:CAMPEP_0194210300 /NCGR_PEP_ID=MMETSP0156-20130528/8145_1 /TAXON_ID=33649 /ORGANISM="Thalassionema nitzschioides, Strain L26-B" /LENGTH=290 /DNA_ID=CAMNT_0038937625 /DNA_START=82 /DNA_END=954 /DNA_ORIENTATION=-
MPVASYCPFVNTLGPALEEANELAVSRLAGFENAYPAKAVGRSYSPGVENPDEVYCDGAEGNKLCNKIHGEWGDSIPRNGEYCAWAVLEFQDPPEYNYCDDAMNTTFFNRGFDLNTQYFLDLPDGPDHVLAMGYTGGVPCGQTSSPWPAASIIFKNGTNYAKNWIASYHMRTISAGYSFGFTFRGHYKAVKCDDISFSPDDPKDNGIYLLIDGTEDYGGKTNDFQVLWNQFRSLDDFSPKFLKGKEGECILDCPVGPCPPEETSIKDNKKGKKATSSKDIKKGTKKSKKI